MTNSREILLRSRGLLSAATFVAGLALALLPAIAQAEENVDVQIYSEFQRFDPFGKVLPQDRELSPREIISPAIARNGHLSVHVVVTAPEGANFFVYAGANPPGILELKLYREHFSRCGNGYCPDWLTEQQSAGFGSIPERYRDPVHPEFDRQTTRSYLLDIRAPADTPPRRVRVEALIKAGTWLVVPMEVRIVAPTVPDRIDQNTRARDTNSGPAVTLFRSAIEQKEDIAGLDEPAAATAALQLLRYEAGLRPELPAAILRVRDIIQRNAAEDMLLARAVGWRLPRGFAELHLLAWWPFLHPPAIALTGSEWFLRVRDFLYRFES